MSSSEQSVAAPGGRGAPHRLIRARNIALTIGVVLAACALLSLALTVHASSDLEMDPTTAVEVSTGS